jgi:hypothetical protein
MQLSGRAASIDERTNVAITNRFHLENTVSLGYAIERLKDRFQQSEDLVRISHRRPRCESRDITNFIAQETNHVSACSSVQNNGKERSVLTNNGGFWMQVSDHISIDSTESILVQTQ